MIYKYDYKFKHKYVTVGVVDGDPKRLSTKKKKRNVKNKIDKRVRRLIGQFVAKELYEKENKSSFSEDFLKNKPAALALYKDILRTYQEISQRAVGSKDRATKIIKKAFDKDGDPDLKKFYEEIIHPCGAGAKIEYVQSALSLQKVQQKFDKNIAQKKPLWSR